MKLRVSEIYPSIQGEGINVGKPTVFVRFAGCNLKCPLWPCDTPHAIDPAIFSKEQTYHTPAELMTATILDYSAIKNICLTGGEPMLQSNAALFEYVDGLRLMKRNVEMFSNGTLMYNSWFLDNVTVCMDWKLPGSGDVFSQKWIDTRANNLILMAHAGRPQSVKFTIANLADYEMAKDVAEGLSKMDNITIYFGAVWGKWTESFLVQHMLEDGLPYHLNVQMHNYIWDRNKRGI